MPTDIIIDALQEIAIVTYRRTVTFINTQIITLRSTPLEIVPAPGVNKCIVPLAANFIIHMGGGAYGNITDASLQLGYDEFVHVISPPIKTASVLASPSVSDGIGVFSIPNLEIGSGGFDGVNVVNMTGNYTNMALVIKDDWSGGGDYTGGNEDNTLKITVYYAIIYV